jgi:phage shock protein PspC (stress-responsive transcriptional regulator)
MNCRDAVAALIGVVENGGVLSAEHREHLRDCARCKELLDSAREVEAQLTPEPVRAPEIDDARLAKEMRQNSRRQYLRRIGWVLLISFGLAATFGTFAAVFDDDVSGVDAAMVVFGVTLLAGIPAVLFYALIAALHDRQGNRIYKRLKPGHVLSGVCLGLSEATGISVLVLRLVFILLAFLDGAGIWLYIVFDLAMPIHPDDRQYLLRFKLRRMWERTMRRFAHVDHGAR